MDKLTKLEQEFKALGLDLVIMAKCLNCGQVFTLENKNEQSLKDALKHGNECGKKALQRRDGVKLAQSLKNN